MGQLDFISIISAFLAFIFFLITHIFVLRCLKKFSAPVLIISSIFIGALSDLGIFVYGVAQNQLINSFLPWALVFSATIAALIYLFLVLHYIAFVFGMGEASIRVRLLFEIPPDGITMENILKNYNAQKILDVRLVRLVTAGHFSFDGTFYQIKNPILLIQLWLIKFFRQFLGIVEEK